MMAAGYSIDERLHQRLLRQEAKLAN